MSSDDVDMYFRFFITVVAHGRLKSEIIESCNQRGNELEHGTQNAEKEKHDWKTYNISCVITNYPIIAVFTPVR